MSGLKAVACFVAAVSVTFEASSSVILVTASNAPPTYAGQVFTIAGSARYSAPDYPVSGAETRISLGGTTTITHTIVGGTYSASVGPLSAGVYTARVFVTDTSVSGTNYLPLSVVVPPSLVVTITNYAPVYAGQPVPLAGSVWLTPPWTPATGAVTIVTLDGHTSSVSVAADGTYNATMPALAASGLYTARVQATEGSLTGGAAAAVSALPAKMNQTIEFQAIGTQYTTGALGLAATASSGLPVTFAVGSGPAVIAGGTNLTFAGSGLVSIVASQAGDASWNPAPEVTNSFTVLAPPPLVIVTPALPGGVALLPYEAALSATGGAPPFAWSVQPRRAVIGWGADQYGQIGGATGLVDIAALSEGNQHGLALRPNGTVVAWGYGGEGRTIVPAGLSNVVQIAAGGYHSLALKSDGTIVGWGRSSEGQLAQPAGLTNVVAISGGGFFTMALRADGTVAAWGENDYGATNVPADLTGVVAVDAGYYHGVALKSNGTVVAWGGAGQNPPVDLTNVVAISAGGFHNLALKSDGTVVAWGLNGSGQRNVPPGLTGVVAVAGGHTHSLALKSDGTIVAWGLNSSGQTNVPPALSGVTAIAAGGDSSLALFNKSPLPDALSFSTNGILSGTPAAGGTSLVTFIVRDSSGATTNRALELLIQAGPPDAPLATAATNVSASGFSANWNAVAAATNYLLDVAADAMFTGVVAGCDNRAVGHVLTWSLTGLAAGHSYFYRVRAQSAGGISGNSGTITATTARAAQTIDFPPVGDQVATNVIGLHAVASSGLPVSFGVSAGPAAISDGTNLSFSGAGLVRIVASQPGDDGWMAAPDVTNTFTVMAKAAAAVSLENLEHLYDGTPKSATATTVPAGLAVVITYDGQPTAPTAPGSYLVEAAVEDAEYEGQVSATLTIHALEAPNNVSATPAAAHPATRALLDWWQTQGLHALISVSDTLPTGAPTPGTTYAAADTFGNQTVVQGDAENSGVEVSGLMPGHSYFFTFYAQNNARYSTGTIAAVTLWYPPVRNTGAVTPEMPADVYLGDTGLVFGCEAAGLLEGNAGRVRVWLSTEPDLEATGQAGPWSDFTPAEHKSGVAPGVFSEIGSRRWGLQIDYGAPFGDAFWYVADSPTWTSAQPPATSSALTVEVKPIALPTDVAGAISESPPQAKVDLSWQLNARGSDVLIVRRPAGTVPVGPPQGTPVGLDAQLGNGYVIYRGSGTSHQDGGVPLGGDFDYTFYSVNNDYYSPGVELHLVIPPFALEPPTNLTATPGAHDFVARWDAVAGATGYRIDVSSAPGFTDFFLPGFDNLAVGDTQVVVTGLLEYATYYFRVRAEGQPGGVSADSATATVQTVAAGITYVSKSGSHTPPFATWETAATNIQDAVDATSPGGRVLVGDGVYDTGSRSGGGGPLCRVVIDKAVRVESLYGPAGAHIVGAWSESGGDPVRGVYLGEGAALSGFTVSGGSVGTEGLGPPPVQTAGGGIFAASPLHTVSNCVIRGNRAFLGAGAAFANLVGCRVESNAASYGGGAYGGTLDRCDIVNNSAGMEGGGAIAPSSVVCCRLTGNIAGWDGGGVADAGDVLGSIISGNWSRRAGGAFSATLRRCTVSGNTAQDFGGGLQNCSASESIVYHNTAPIAANYVASGFDHCYTDPAPAGSCAVDPKLASPVNGHLLPGSPCIDAAQSSSGLAGDVDGDAVPAGAAEDIGADEFNAAGAATPLAVRLTVDSTQAMAGTPLAFRLEVEGIPLGISLDFGDGTGSAGACIASHAYGAAGSYVATAVATNAGFGAAASVTVQVSAADTILYVSPGGGHVPPFDSWANAATTIQAAVEAAPLGATVLVTNGEYRTGGRLYPGTLLTNVVIATNAVRILSVNGPAVTIIGGSNQVTARGVFLGSAAVLDGFTVRNFKSRGPGSDLTMEMAGGGIFCASTGALVRHCVIAGCRAETWGGGIYSGTLFDSLVLSNSAGYAVIGGGGGAYNSVLWRCRVVGNSATYSQSGGGLSNCGAYDSILERNTGYDGGGAIHSELVRCLVRSNSASYRGGGTASTLLRSCLVTRNTAASSGGGCQFGALQNSTVVSNQAGANGGAQLVMATNSIICGNLPNDYGSLNACYHTCVSPLPPIGNSNIDVDPLFCNADAGDYRLATNSPCINAGTNIAWMAGEADLDGNPRIQEGTADIGAYEYPSYTTNGILRAWLRGQSLPDNGTADGVDFDGDGYTCGSEWVSGTDPLTAGSSFDLIDPLPGAGGSGVTLRWPYVEGRLYSILWCDSLLGNAAWQCTDLDENSFTVGGGVASWTDPMPAGAGPRIYRIAVRLR